MLMGKMNKDNNNKKNKFRMLIAYNKRRNSPSSSAAFIFYHTLVGVSVENLQEKNDFNGLYLNC